MTPAPAPTPTPTPTPAPGTTPASHAEHPISDHAREIYRNAIVVDLHNDLPAKVLDDAYDPHARHEPRDGHTDVPRLVDSGVTAQFFAAWVDAPFARTIPDSSFARACRLIDVIHDVVQRHPAELSLATTANDIRRAKRDRMVAILIGIEGGHAIECSLDNLRALYARGARYLTLTWNNGNAWAGSSIGEHGTRTGGLTAFGEQVVRELNRLGMLVDLSHVSDETFEDAVATSTAPVIASHSCARALCDHPRNLTDAQLRAVADTGGLVGVNFYPRFLEPRMGEAMDAVEAELAACPSTGSGDEPTVRRATDLRRRELLSRIPPTPLGRLIDHIDHIARVAGIEHVALGSDFDGIGVTPTGMDDIASFPRLVQALLDRGYDDADITKILGGNVLRVMDRVLVR